MTLHDMFHDRKPKARSAHFARSAFVDSIEALEQAIEMLIGNAGSVIDDSQDDLVLCLFFW